ncbi:hypothetical protein B0H14DRAFT_2609473 [Mycena olivaceomarginata]|nr:hypothetical protein B0H14DRAFT_2609473 [Mycena olivaceomarginata]
MFFKAIKGAFMISALSAGPNPSPFSLDFKLTKVPEKWINGINIRRAALHSELQLPVVYSSSTTENIFMSSSLLADISVSTTLNTNYLQWNRSTSNIPRSGKESAPTGMCSAREDILERHTAGRTRNHTCSQFENTGKPKLPSHTLENVLGAQSGRGTEIKMQGAQDEMKSIVKLPQDPRAVGVFRSRNTEGTRLEKRESRVAHQKLATPGQFLTHPKLQIRFTSRMNRHTTTVQSGSAGSKRLKIFSTDRKTASHPRPRLQEKTLGPRAIAEYRRHGQEDARICLENMETGQCDAVMNLQGLAEDPDFDAGATHFDMEGVLDGSECIDISHAGGEMGSWEDNIEEGSDEEGPEVKRRISELKFGFWS